MSDKPKPQPRHHQWGSGWGVWPWRGPRAVAVYDKTEKYGIPWPWRGPAGGPRRRGVWRGPGVALGRGAWGVGVGPGVALVRWLSIIKTKSIIDIPSWRGVGRGRVGVGRGCKEKAPPGSAGQ